MQNTYRQLWDKTLSLIRSSGYFGEDTMSWFEKATLFKIEDEKAYISYKSVIASNLLHENEQLFTDTLSELWGANLQLRFISQKEMEKLMPGELIKQRTNTLLAKKFDPAYTFDSFVKGPSNQEALAACQAVCKANMRSMFNPLMIYGNSGLGKTHLLNAVGNEIKEKYPEKKVIFLYSGDLVTLLIDAMKTKNETGNTVDQVKAMLLDCDYFLIDDIQNLRHASSQEVFFTVYNELIREKKQIILTSDTHPAELSTLTKRLISRFSSGLTVNISKPGAETAKEILRKKINGHEDIFDIEEEVLDFLAISYSNDIRSLEGVLNRLIFNATLFNPPAIDMGFTLGVLKDEPVVSQSAEVDARAVKKAVVRYYGLSYKDIEGKSRQRKIALARQICIYLMREVLALPYAAIGMELGGRDHTTISSACSAAKKKYASDPTYKEVVDSLKAKLTVQST